MAKLVVIEDENIIREELIEALTFEGFEVIGTKNGMSGVEMVQQVQPDLVICDILLPQLDGYKVLSTLKAQPETAHIPLIFLTCLHDPEAIEKAFTLGACAYLIKPFKHSDLLSAIQGQLSDEKPNRHVG